MTLSPPRGIAALASVLVRSIAFNFAAPLLSASVLLTYPGELSAQERPDPSSSGSGARAAGMSNAVTAVVNDVFSIGWNPAGLAQLARPEFGISGHTAILATSASGTTNDPRPTGFPRYGATGEFFGASDPLEFVGAAVPFKIGKLTLAAGVAYRRFAGEQRAGSFNQRRRVNNGRYFSTTVYTTEGTVRAISPTLAVGINERVQVGLTANLLSGSSEYRVKGPLTFRSGLEERDYSGLALELGTMVRLLSGMRLGLSATLPHDVSFILATDSTAVAATRAAPLQLAAGVSRRLNPKTVLSVDVRSAPWSADALTEDATGNTIPTNVGVRSAASLHVGWERDVSGEDRLGVMHRGTFRLGGFARTTTSVDLYDKQISAFGGSLGKSWELKKGMFEMGLLFSRSTKWTRSEDLLTTVSIANNDYVLTAGFRRLF